MYLCMDAKRYSFHRPFGIPQITLGKWLQKFYCGETTDKVHQDEEYEVNLCWMNIAEYRARERMKASKVDNEYEK